MSIQVLSELGEDINSQNQTLNNLGGNLIYEKDSFVLDDTKIEVTLTNTVDNTANTIYDFKNYQPVSDPQLISEISIDPKRDFLNLYGGGIGQFKLSYLVYNNLIGSSNQRFYIKEISPNKTEIRLDSTSIPPSTFLGFAENLKNTILSLNYQPAFSLNFGNNIIIDAVNIDTDGNDIEDGTILVKLQDPLPTNLQLNSTLWIIDTLTSPSSYTIISTPDPVKIKDTLPIKGPNFNVDVKDQVNNSTLPLSYIDLIKTNQTSSLNQLNNILNEKEININVDYTDFNNFVHFSSAKTRIENFYYKIQLIESYSSSLSTFIIQK